MVEWRNLSRSNVPSQRAMLEELAALAPDAPVDTYGAEVTRALEERVAELFRMEACLVMPSGKAMQNAALKIWAMRSGCDRIAIHPRSHIEEEEGRAHHEVFGLRSSPFGPNHAQPSLADLTSIRDPLGAASIEIALRPVGGTLIPWDNLMAMSDHCRRQGIPFHADGARVWEAQVGYGKTFPEIAALFDSLYVSFYKVLGGLFGGALLGSHDFVDEARVWQKRLGQTPYRQFPYVLAATRGLEEMLPRVPDFCRRAHQLSCLIADLDGVFAVTPRPAQTNMFQVHLQASVPDLRQARDVVRDRLGLNLFDDASGTALEGVSMFEIIAGPATLELTDQEVSDAMAALIAELGGTVGGEAAAPASRA